MGFFLVPWASEGFNDFRYTYLSRKKQTRETANVFRQISANEFIYVSNFNPETKVAFNFTIEKFKGDQLESKLSVGRLRYNAKDSSYTMFNYTKRTVGPLGDKLESA